MMSESRTTTYCLPLSASNSVPLYFWYSTVLPTLTVGFTALPSSSDRPGPTATTCTPSVGVW